MATAASPAAPPTVAADDAQPSPRRRSVLAHLVVTAVLVGAAAVMDVLISWYLPPDVPSCPPDGALLDCADAMTALLVPGAAAVAGLVVWLVGAMARERRGGVVWCWVAVVVAAAPAVFLVPGLVF